jgi:hypothetical protein
VNAPGVIDWRQSTVHHQIDSVKMPAGYGKNGGHFFFVHCTQESFLYPDFTNRPDQKLMA